MNASLFYKLLASGSFDKIKAEKTKASDPAILFSRLKSGIAAKHVPDASLKFLPLEVRRRVETLVPSAKHDKEVAWKAFELMQRKGSK